MGPRWPKAPLGGVKRLLSRLLIVARQAEAGASLGDREVLGFSAVPVVTGDALHLAVNEGELRGQVGHGAQVSAVYEHRGVVQDAYGMGVVVVGGEARTKRLTICDRAIVAGEAGHGVCAPTLNPLEATKGLFVTPSGRSKGRDWQCDG